MKTNLSSEWKCVLQLDSTRSVIAGSDIELRDAIRRGADLRIYVEFKHNEHIDTSSDNPEIIRETSEFATTYLLDNSWVAGIMSNRQPISLPDMFAPRPSMSFFLYNQDGSQAIARPYLDQITRADAIKAVQIDIHDDMPKSHSFDRWDDNTNAPSQNFVYDFETFKYYVRDNWREILHNDASGKIVSGSIKKLADAFTEGCEVKVGVSGLCDDFGNANNIEHEVFVKTGYDYYYTEQELFISGTYPLVRVKPNIPMEYTSNGWDFGWLLVRTDGYAVQRICNPYSLNFTDTKRRLAMRWFIR
jgi:hypothetical protein